MDVDLDEVELSAVMATPWGENVDGRSLVSGKIMVLGDVALENVNGDEQHVVPTQPGVMDDAATYSSAFVDVGAVQT